MIHKRKTDTREKRSDAHEEDGEKNLVEDTHINLRNAAMCSLPLSLSLSPARKMNSHICDFRIYALTLYTR